MKKKRLPRLKSDADLAKFVETHDTASLFRAMDSADKTLTLSPELADRIRERAKKKLIALRLPQWQIDTAKSLARRKNKPYQALMREWIGIGVRREIEALARLRDMGPEFVAELERWERSPKAQRRATLGP